MPIYEYCCSSCGVRKEHLQKISDPKLSTCPECGKETYEKQLTAAGFQLKGSGWYVTDFRNGSAKASTTKPAGDAKTDAAPDSGKDADSAKPAASDAAASSPAPAPAAASPTPTSTPTTGS